MLLVDALTFQYPGDRAMRFDVQLPVGGVLAVTGPSGCGKSTFLNLLAGFQKPSAGRVSWAGQDLLGRPADQRGISMLFQSHNLFDHLTAAQNIDLGSSPNRRPSAVQIQARDEAMECLGIQGLQDRLPGQLSGGQQQRVALARSLVSDRPLVLLDEPFSALDASSRADARAALLTLQSQGKTLVLVTHDPADIALLQAQQYDLG